MNPFEFQTARMFSPLFWHMTLKAVEKCPQCKREYTNPIDKEAIRDWGKCTGCDKLDLNPESIPV